MKQSTHTVAVLFLGGVILLTVPTAFAYVTPEQKLIQNQYDGFVPSEDEEDDLHYAAPEELNKKPSGVLWQKEPPVYRDQKSDNEHITLTKYRAQSSAASDIVAEEEEPEEIAGTETDSTSGISVTIDPRALRILERLTSPRPVELENTHGGAPLDDLGKGKGKGKPPLTPTGPTTVLVMGAILFAIGATVRRARKLEQ